MAEAFAISGRGVQTTERDPMAGSSGARVGADAYAWTRSEMGLLVRLRGCCSRRGLSRCRSRAGYIDAGTGSFQRLRGSVAGKGLAKMKGTPWKMRGRWSGGGMSWPWSGVPRRVV